MNGVAHTPEELDTKKRAIIEYLLSTPGGTFYRACEKAGAKLSTAYDWRKNDPEFGAQAKEAMKIADSIGGDIAEEQLQAAIKDGNITAIIYYLKTKCKDRGYSESQNINLGGQNGENPLSANLLVSFVDSKPLDDEN